MSYKNYKPFSVATLKYKTKINWILINTYNINSTTH